jgi:exosome complex component RRP41
MQKKNSIKLIDENDLRTDGRKINEIRPTRVELGIIDNPDGSAFLEQGKNKILAAVYGPRELHPKHLALSDRALLRCRYNMAPFSTKERKSPAPSRRETEISKVIKSALEPAIFLEKFPRTVIDLYIVILSSDGGTRCAGINAASLALAEAGIPMRDLVVACAAGKVDGQIVLDLNGIEDNIGDADVPVAFMPRTNEITLLQMDGMLSREEFEKTLKLAMDGGNQIYNIQKEALKSRYQTSEKEEMEE